MLSFATKATPTVSLQMY